MEKEDWLRGIFQSLYTIDCLGNKPEKGMVWLINFKGKTAKKPTVHKFRSEKWCTNADINELAKQDGATPLKETATSKQHPRNYQSAITIIRSSNSRRNWLPWFGLRHSSLVAARIQTGNTSRHLFRKQPTALPSSSFNRLWAQNRALFKKLFHLSQACFV